MEEIGTNPTQLARELNTGRQTIYQWLKGTRPQQDRLRALADALGVHGMWLAHGDPPKEKGAELPPVDEEAEGLAGATLNAIRKALVDGSLQRGLQSSGSVRAKALALLSALEEEGA